MSRLLGIDIGASHVRVALVTTSYKRVAVERLLEVEIESVESLEAALQACVVPLAGKLDAIAVGLDGESTFVHRITLPASARKQLEQVLPFELEAQLPIEIDEVVFDHQVIGRPGPNAPLSVVAAAARTEHVRERIALVRRALGSEPDRVGCGPLPLANLVNLEPALGGLAAIGLVDLSATTTDVLVLHRGEAVFARTLSRGLQDLPEGAPALVAELRQTIAAYAAQAPEPIEQLVLVGAGALDPHAAGYLAHFIGLPTDVLGPIAVQGVAENEQSALPRFAKALGLALSLGPRAKDLDLRQGELVRRAGYDFLKEKVPLLAGLGAAILISVLFSTWAELRSLGRERELLEPALAAVSKEVLGTELTDADEVINQLTGGGEGSLGDPMPRADAFDVMNELSTAIPTSITHDAEELDLSARGHVKITGIVPSKNDAQQVEAAMKRWKCARDVKLGKLTQQVGSDKQKYTLEFDLRCPEDAQKKKTSKKEEPAKDASKETAREEGT